jgi:hypothetical protein
MADTEVERLRIGDLVQKPDGYPFDGVVVSAFTTQAGLTRYVVESEIAPGMLHIFSGKQIKRRDGSGTPGDDEMVIAVASAIAIAMWGSEAASVYFREPPMDVRYKMSMDAARAAINTMLSTLTRTEDNEA